jgi:hypothetical protein
MQLSSETLTILKNFASINQSIYIKEGSKLRTISGMRNVLAEATVAEEFPKDFALYDLNQFLNGLSLHDKPQLDFDNDSYLVIKEGKRRAKYFYADPSVIISPPDKDITMPSVEVEFELEHSQLQKILKAASVYQLFDLAVVGEDGTVRLIVRDKKNDTSNEYSLEVGETKNKFVFNFKIENLKLLPASYEVKLSKNNISQFKNTKADILYTIALEPDSTFS